MRAFNRYGAAVLLLALAAARAEQGAGPRVEIRRMEFAPQVLTIARGQTVTWINGDTMPHTATSPLFDTDVIRFRQSASVRFEQPGTYAYECSFHGQMRGTIIVE